MLILPQLIDGPWSNRPRVAILEIIGQIGVQVRAQEMVRTIKALQRGEAHYRRVRDAVEASFLMNGGRYL